MIVISKAAIKHVALKVITDVMSHANGAELDIRARQAFRHRYQIRDNVPMVHRKPLTRASKTSHHLISDQEYSIFVAKSTQVCQIAIRWNQDSVGARYRLNDNRRNRFWSLKFDHLFRA